MSRVISMSVVVMVVCVGILARGATGTTVRLSSGSATDQQNQPAISGTNVVWTEAATPPSGGATNFDIYYDNVATGGTPLNLTNTPGDQEFLEDIDGTTVVWTHTSAGIPGDIVAYDLATNRTSTIASSSTTVHFEQPAVSGQWVTFLRVTPSQIDVYLYDNLNGNPIGLVTNDAAVQGRPRVGGGVVVYEDYSSGNADVMGYTIPSGPSFAIATGANAQVTPDASGNTVVYIEHTAASDQVFAFDLTTGVTTQLTTAPSTKVLPRISGNRIVWSDDRNGNLDLYYYDLATNQEAPLVSGPGDQFLSDIDGDRVVYTDNSAGFEQVSMFTFDTTNNAPIANAGVDQTITYTATLPTVQLDGCASTDDGRPNPPGALSYHWQQIAGAETVALSNPSACNPTFIAPALATGSDVLTFELTVGDGQLTSQATANITLTSADHAPECSATAPVSVAEGTLGVVLDGSTSFDPDGDSIASHWVQTGGPALTLTTPDSAIAYFDAPLLGGGSGTTQTFTFQHAVSDGELSASCDVSVVVTKIDNCPLANAGLPRTVAEGSTVVLDGSASTDPDGDTLLYAWVQTAGPTVALENASSATPRFSAPFVGAGGADLVFELGVDDQFGCARSASVTVHVANVSDAPTCGTARATPALVWPPNHKLVPIHIVDVGTNGLATTVTVTGITQDERPGTGPDAAIANGAVLVRAERDGDGDGRVYHVQLTATNAQGSCTGDVPVCVPHSGNSTCVDGGPLFNSLLP